MFSLKLFGGGQVEGPHGPLAGRVSYRQRLGLLALLALSPDRRQRREKLLAFLWPENEERRARHHLADTVYLIRRELGDDAILNVGDDLLLNPEVLRTDVWDFEEALTKGDLRRAAELYTGPLLDGFHLSGAGELERWLDSERDRTSRAYVQVLEGLARESAAGDDPGAAVGWWRQLASQEPYNGRIAGELMRALDAAGDRAGALQHARVYTRLVRDDIGIEPDAEIVRLAERLRNEPVNKPIEEPAGHPADPQTIAATGVPASVQLEEPEPSDREIAADGLSVVGEGTPESLGSIPQAGWAPEPGRARSLFRSWVVRSLLLATPVLLYIWLRPAATETDPVEIRALAVLPIQNLSGDPAQEYVADGMTEALIRGLSQLDGIKVISRTSIMRFKGSEQTIPEIARILSVDALIEGSVQRAGERLLVNIQLIDGASDTHFWVARYEREVTDLLDMQGQVARAVAEQIGAQLPAEASARIASAGTADPAAYEQYIIGRYHFWRFNENDLVRAIAAFERATEIDPLYASAFAGLAQAWWARGIWGSVGFMAAESPARAAARRALELDDHLAEAHAVNADIMRLYDLDWAGAENAVRRALELDPNDVRAHYTYAMLLMSLDRLPEAIAHMESAEERDPLAPAIQASMGRIMYRARRFEDAIARFDRAIELEPGDHGTYARLGDVYEELGRYEEALALHQRAYAADGGRAGYALRIARVMARMGRHTDARRELMELEAVRPDLPKVPAARVYAALGDHDKAFELLFSNIDERNSLGIFIKSDPPFRGLHHDPRWSQLLRRMNLN